MTTQNLEQPNSTGQKGKPDWVTLGSLVVIVVSLLGMVYIFWTRYRPGN